MNNERRDHTLQATALVHEVYAKMMGQQDHGWNNRRHFYFAATQSMRQILIDHARMRGRLKRGGASKHNFALDIADCNGNGQPDVIDIALGTSLDIDGDKIPDECESFMTGSGNPGNSNGIVRTIWETPGLTSLTSFNPDSSSVTAVSSSIVSDASESISFPKLEYSGSSI